MNPRLHEPLVTEVAPPTPPERLAPFLQVSERGDHLQYWVEFAVGDAWLAACLMKIRDGRPMIAELRLVPAEAHVGGITWPPGTWSGTWNPDAPIPGNGITAGLLRKQLSLTVAFDQVKDRRERFAEMVAAQWGPTKEARGRKPKPSEFYARVASDYVEALKRGSRRPAADVAASLGISPELARAYIKRARDGGLLSGRTQGQKGGVLTEKATALLRRSPRKRGGRR